MKTKFLFLLILPLTLAAPAFASSPPWTGDATYTFSDADPFFMENGIYDTATVNIIGGSFGSLRCYNQSTVNMWGGSGSLLWGKEESTINLYGGTLNGIAGSDDAEIFLWVDSCNIDFDTYIGYDARLTGVWFGNNGEFDILVRENSYSHVSIVPEPSLTLLLGMGTIFLRKKRCNN